MVTNPFLMVYRFCYLLHFCLSYFSCQWTLPKLLGMMPPSPLMVINILRKLAVLGKDLNPCQVKENTFSQAVVSV